MFLGVAFWSRGRGAWTSLRCNQLKTHARARRRAATNVTLSIDSRAFFALFRHSPHFRHGLFHFESPILELFGFEVPPTSRWAQPPENPASPPGFFLASHLASYFGPRPFLAPALVLYVAFLVEAAHLRRAASAPRSQGDCNAVDKHSIGGEASSVPPGRRAAWSAGRFDPAKCPLSLDEAKAEDVVSIDYAENCAGDEMIIATGRSTCMRAIADKVVKACKAAGVAAPRVEGLPHCDWVLVDAGDVIVDVFRPEVRQFYNLEQMWGGDRPRELRLA